MSSNISEEQFYQLLSLKLSGDATSEELELLREQLERHPEWQFLYDQMVLSSTQIWEQPDHTHQAFAAHVTKMQLQGLLDDTERYEQGTNDIGAIVPLKNRARKMGIFATAVSMGAIIIVLGLLKFRRQGRLPQLNEVVTQKGSRSNVRLPDGTRVWLNADSKLTYNQDFGEHDREVFLMGEAYFDVGHDGEHPFIIHTGPEEIKVLGTVFNVRNYPEDLFLETTLVSGKIEVTMAGQSNEGVVLRPFEKLRVSKQGDSLFKTTVAPLPATAPHALRVAPADIPQHDSITGETAWLVDKMIFVNEQLGVIAHELERHFAISIVFKHPKTETIRYTGVFDNLSLETILQILKESNNINYKIEGKHLIID